MHAAIDTFLRVVELFFAKGLVPPFVHRFFVAFCARILRAISDQSLLGKEEISLWIKASNTFTDTCRDQNTALNSALAFAPEVELEPSSPEGQSLRDDDEDEDNDGAEDEDDDEGEDYDEDDDDEDEEDEDDEDDENYESDEDDEDDEDEDDDEDKDKDDEDDEDEDEDDEDDPGDARGKKRRKVCRQW